MNPRLLPFRPLFPCVPWSRGKGGSVFTNQIARIQFLTNQGPLFRISLLLKQPEERLKQPGVLAASMDLFCFYRGRLLPETYAFCAL